MAADGERMTRDTTTTETPDDREELRTLVAQLRTNIGPAAAPVCWASPDGRCAQEIGRPRRGDATASPPPQPPTSVTMKPSDPQDEERDPGAPRGAAGLKLVREELGDCKRCKLCTTRTNIVFGVGNPEASLVFVGEAPGADEDAQGEPVRRQGGPAADEDDRGDGLCAR